MSFAHSTHVHSAEADVATASRQQTMTPMLHKRQAVIWKTSLRRLRRSPFPRFLSAALSGDKYESFRRGSLKRARHGPVLKFGGDSSGRMVAEELERHVKEKLD